MAQKPVSIWRDVNLIGRSKLAKKLQGMVLARNRFVLKGVPGVGKSALLEMCYEIAKAHYPSAFVDARDTYLNILKKIVEDWDLDVEPSRGKNPVKDDYETAILQEVDNLIFVDNLNDAKKQKAYLFKVLAERHVISGAMPSRTKINEELKQFFWFIKNEVDVPKLKKKHSEDLTKSVCLYLGSKVSIKEVAEYSRGLPGRIVAYATSGGIPKEDIQLESEEIDISWVLLILAGGVILFRYLGRSIGATDFVLLGGAGMILVLLVRLLVQKGKA